MQPEAPELIVMLTHHDYTVSDAARIFERCRDSKARCWGIKEHRLPPDEMKRLFTQMKECGKTTFLEVVGYTEEEGLAGAELAFKCGCDVVMGTKFHDSINDYCKSHHLKYMPFVGKVTGRPSILAGTVEEMIDEARGYLTKGVFGIDLLGYRYEGDACRLISTFIKEVKAPVCLAGSIDSYQRLDEVRKSAPWAFTIGSAFFEGKFLRESANITAPSDALDDIEIDLNKFRSQINNVYEYMAGANEVVDYYDSIATTYDKSRFDNSYGQFIDSEERKVMDLLMEGHQPGGLRLDMACGTGRLTNYATHGLDASAEMIKIAIQRHPSVTFKQASACETGFPDQMFDVVYSFHLMMHLDKTTISEILNEVHRILKPGGRFIMDIPSKKRRQLLHHRQTSWHGGTEMTEEELREMADGLFEIRRNYGVMLLPLHRLPERIRQPLLEIDYSMANGWLKAYSSYLVYEFVKQDQV